MKDIFLQHLKEILWDKGPIWHANLQEVIEALEEFGVDIDTNELGLWASYTRLRDNPDDEDELFGFEKSRRERERGQRATDDTDDLLSHERSRKAPRQMTDYEDQYGDLFPYERDFYSEVSYRATAKPESWASDARSILSGPRRQAVDFVRDVGEVLIELLPITGGVCMQFEGGTIDRGKRKIQSEAAARFIGMRRRARENPTEAPSARVFVYDITDPSEPEMAGDDETFPDLDLALQAAARLTEPDRWVVVMESFAHPSQWAGLQERWAPLHELDERPWEGGRLLMSVHDSEFIDVTNQEHLGWRTILRLLIDEQSARKNPARLSDVSQKIINGGTVDRLCADIDTICTIMDVFSPDEVQAFVEYCHMALSSVPEEDQWRITTLWYRDQENPLENKSQYREVVAYGRARTMVLELAGNQLSVRTVPHAAAREASPVRLKPLFERHPGNVLDMSYVEFAIPAYMLEEPDRQYARAPLLLPNHDDIIATGDWVHARGPDTKDAYGRPAALGRYTFVGARHPGEER